MTSPNNITAEWHEHFLEIQSYQDDDVSKVLSRLLQDKGFISSISKLFNSAGSSLIAHFETLAKVNSVEELQSWVEKYIFPIVANSYDRLSVSGLIDLEPDKAYIFISNHRDIVMDPLVLNHALRAHNFSTANCAIGDNLLVNQNANDLALLNRCFKIFRSIKSPRAILNAMKTQSAYIQYLLFNKTENVWIAQKEGRSKDNIDKTNPALIKMLGLSKPKEMPISDYLSRLNIVPVSISYEWDPCDIDKAVELAAQENNAEYTKDKLDDFIATQKGLDGQKGNMHIHFGEVITNLEDEQLAHKLVAAKIDQSIQSNYQHFPVNYAAHKKIHGVQIEHEHFTKQEVNHAHKELDKRLENISDDIIKRVYQAYAQTLG